MPRKPKAAKEEELDDDLALDEVPKAKVKPARKAKAKAPAVVDDDVDDEDAPKPAKKPKAEPKKKHKDGETFTDEQGFTCVVPSIIYKCVCAYRRTTHTAPQGLRRGPAQQQDRRPRLCTTVYTHARPATHPPQDGTLIVDRKVNEKQKAAGKKEWDTFNDEVKPKLEQWLEEGYRLVVFTYVVVDYSAVYTHPHSNQGGIKSALEGKMAVKVKEKINEFLEAMDLPITVLIAPASDRARKPDVGMWEFLRDNLAHGHAPGAQCIQLTDCTIHIVSADASQSFFVGDAAGRPGDHSDSDMYVYPRFVDLLCVTCITGSLRKRSA